MRNSDLSDLFGLSALSASWGLSALLGLALPVDCAGCGAPDVVACPACRAVVSGAPQRVAEANAWTAGRYEGPTARLVLAWKDRGRVDLAPVLAPALARAVTAALVATDGPAALDAVLVPVPSSPGAVRRRGADVVLDLARRAARLVTPPGGGQLQVAAALRLTRSLTDQATLGVEQRRRNVDGAFAVRRRAAPSVRGRPCVVVDDVITTGASSAEAVRAVTAAGGRVLAVATICATPRRRGLSGRSRLD